MQQVSLTGLGLVAICLITTNSCAPIPVVTSPASAIGTVGSPFSYLIYASNSSTSYSAAPLPAGLSVDKINGIISGNPTQAGTTTVTISAIGASLTVTAKLTLKINAQGSTVVETYSGPPNTTTYLSNLYTVDVYNGSEWLSSYTYQFSRKSVVSAWYGGSAPSVNFTTFGTTGPVLVSIKKNRGTISSLDLSPKSKNISVSIINGQAILTLNENDKVWITVNGDAANPLYVFADAPKPAIPNGATYFPPGVVDIAPENSNHYQAKNNEVIYLDAGAWVRGNIDVAGTTDVQIMGPGVLSGELWTSEMVNPLPFSQFQTYSMINGDPDGDHCSVQGITIVDSPAYNIHYVYSATGVKLLSPWYYSTDGFYALHTDQCFAFVGDNVFFPLWYWGGSENVTIANSFGGNSNNGVFCGGYWGFAPDTAYAALVDNVDIKTYGGGGSLSIPSVFQTWVDNTDSTYGFHNQTYQNIRIDGNLNGPLAQLENRVYPYGKPDPDPPLGKGSNFIFKNIGLEGTQSGLSEVLGYDKDNGWSNVSFQDLSINGTLVTAANARDYINTNRFVSKLDFSYTKNMTITATAGVGGIISPCGSTLLTAGASQTFLITPAAGLAITKVTVDNVPQGAISSYTFTKVNASHTIRASFGPVPK